MLRLFAFSVIFYVFPMLLLKEQTYNTSNTKSNEAKARNPNACKPFIGKRLAFTHSLEIGLVKQHGKGGSSYLS